MRKVLLASAALLGFALLPTVSHAQLAQGTQTYWNGSRLDAASTLCSIAGAVNHTQAAGTCTITPPAGQRVFFTYIAGAACQDGTASISGIQLNFTSTNLGGFVQETSTLSAATITTNPFANMCAPWGGWLGNPLVSAQPGVAVTLVPPAQTAHMSFPITALGYFAP